MLADKLRYDDGNLPDPPVIIVEPDNPQLCILFYTITITGPIGSELYYNLGIDLPDPFCGDEQSQYVPNNIVTFRTGNLHVGTNYLKAISCTDGVSSAVAVTTVEGGECLQTLDPPIISYTQQSDTLVTFSVTKPSCGITYINFGTGIVSDPSPSFYMAMIQENQSVYNGQIEGNDWAKASYTTFSIKARTYFDKYDCPNIYSNVAFISDCCILE